ncbi:MAG: hypothetical protein ACI8PZ_006476 [Myxococcota bacterium]|jgi:hypothetical protein
MSRSKRGEDAEELDLVPIMNLVTILIPFLLMASSFVSLAVIDSTLPAIGAPQESSDDKDETLSLSIAVTDEGYTVMGNDPELKGPEEEGEEKGPTIPCKQLGCPTVAAYDTKELTRLLGKLKDGWPDEENVILVPESDVAYEVLIMTMDATRNDPSNTDGGKARELFPYVVIAGGAE